MKRHRVGTAATVATLLVGIASGAAGCGRPASAAPDAVASAGTPSATATSPTPTATPEPGLPPQEAPDDIDCDQVDCVALTFDDGPGQYTDSVLNALDAAGARATFFMIGRNALNFPAQAKRVHGMDMEIGDHTQDHPDLTTLSPAAALHQEELGAKSIQAVTGERPALLRPPGGAYKVGVTPYDGMPVVLWQNDTRDWAVRDRDQIVAAALDKTKPGDIVLMHEIVKATVDGLPDIIAGLRRKGYRLVTVSKLLGAMRPGGIYRHR